MTPTRRPMAGRCAALVAGVMLAVAALAGVGVPVAAQSGIGANLRARLQAVIDQARVDEPVPGISAAVATPDDSWVGVSGKALLEPGAPVEPNTPFAVASVTKTFVAATIMQLREEGRLALGDKLSRWETRVPNASRITIRHLLSHTSGVRDMWRHPSYKARVEGRPDHVWTYAEVRAMIGPSRFAPGTAYEYSNSNYVLLGRIIRLETGRSVAREIRTRFLDPLGLDDTWYQGAEAGPRATAMGYKRGSGAWKAQSDGTGLRPTTSIATFFGASGAMASTARDISHWARALYGGRVLRRSSLDLMTTFDRHDYGLGTRRKTMGGRTVWGHGGSLDGFETSMWYIPDIDSAVVLIWNRRDWESDGVAARLARRIINALDPDTTPPVMGRPRLSLPIGIKVTAGRAPVKVGWSAARDSQGIVAAYQMRRRSGSGAWQPARQLSAATREVMLSVATDRQMVVAVRAVDDRGNVSAWQESIAVVPRFIDESDPSIRIGAGWRTRAAPDSIGGRVLSSTTPGSRISIEVRGHALAIVSPRSRVLSRASVRTDARPTTVIDLHAAARRPRLTVLARQWTGTPVDHSVRVYVRDARKPRIDIDGFLVLEAPATK